MSSWFITLNIVLLFSLSFVQTHLRHDSKRPYPISNNPFDDKSFLGLEDDSLTESIKTIPTTSSNNRANEQQIEQFKRLLFERLNLNEPPNVSHDGTGIPSIVKELEQEPHSNQQQQQQQQNREEIQSTTERAILPGDSIPHHACQRQLAAKFHLNKNNLHNIDCFRFTKSSSETKILPTNQIVKQLRIYVKKNYFFFNDEQEDIMKPELFQIYQVFRPTFNDTLHNPLPGLSDTIRLTISQVKQLNYNWFELTIDPNSQPITIQQIYQQFITPWYGLAINHALQSSWSTFYRRYYSKKHLENFLRSNNNEENESKESQHQLPYMLVEYGEKFSSSSRNRHTRGTGKRASQRVCDSKSPCCRQPLIIDLDHGSNALDFLIYPRQLDIGQCVGLCGTSGSSLKHVDIKNDQYKGREHSGHQFILVHSNAIYHNRSTTTTQVNKPDQLSGHCCSYSRTGGFDVMYSTRNGGPIIRKFLPNMIVEECRCGLPATI